MRGTLHDQVVDHARLLVQLVGRLEDEDDVEPGGATAELVERLFVGLESLHDAVVHLDHEVVPDDVAIGDPDSKRRAYRELVDRIRVRLAAELSPGSVVAVVSRGDASLLELPGLIGRHYPQNELGVYAGYHPATGREAVDHLTDLCRQGARYLAIPATSLWWLDFYDELREHLRTRARLVVADDDLALYEMSDQATTSPPDAAAARYHHQVGQFIELADALLPAGALMLVVTRGDDALASTRRVRARHFPSNGAGVYSGHPRDDQDAIRLLGDHREPGTAYFAVPAPLRWWATTYPSFHAHLQRMHRCIADHAEVGVIFELIPPTTG